MGVLEGKNVLVAGGSGTFGSAFVKKALTLGVERLAILSRDEFKQSEMKKHFQDERLRFFLGDVRDRGRLELAFRGVDIVIHAAALKQVPAGEVDPSEFIKTNIIGTENVLMAADNVGVKQVLVLSSDKASAPITLYGATKNVAEHLTRAAQGYTTGKTKFAALRYGNVAGSRGSIIPTWRKMLSEGVTKVPVTHQGMTRFFFSIDSAVEFALWSLENMHGGELFVPKMPSFYVVDLAKAMGARDFEVIGIRGAEKLHEVMVADEEARYFREWGGRYVRFHEGREQGELLPERWEYRSDTNQEWLDVDGLRGLL